MAFRSCVAPALNCHIQLMLLFINVCLVTDLNQRAVLYQIRTGLEANIISKTGQQ